MNVQQVFRRSSSSPSSSLIGSSATSIDVQVELFLLLLLINLHLLGLPASLSILTDSSASGLLIMVSCRFVSELLLHSRSTALSMAPIFAIPLLNELGGLWRAFCALTATVLLLKLLLLPLLLDLERLPLSFSGSSILVGRPAVLLALPLLSAAEQRGRVLVRPAVLRSGCLVLLMDPFLLQIEGIESFSDALVDTLQVLDVELFVADQIDRAFPSSMITLLFLLAHHGDILSLGGGWVLVLDHLVLGLAALHLQLHLHLYLMIFGRLFRIVIMVGNIIINCHIRFLIVDVIVDKA